MRLSSARCPRRLVAVLTATLLMAASVAMLPASAAAVGPVEPTMSLAQLQAALDASPDGRVAGYFKTVLKGATISQIPVDVVAITAVGNPDGSGMPSRLIMFEATGTAIAGIGGIASGMSGSPVFVDDGGTDKLVGAVSYGDIFTLHNVGLATPIDDMVAIETVYPVAPTTLGLPDPVRLSGRQFSRVVVAPDGKTAAKASAEKGTLVVAPLTTLQIGGIPASSRLFKQWKAYLAERGISLVSAPMGGYDPSFETTLTGGASVASLASRGDMWYGAAGTVTYANGANVVAFGHPLFWEGPTGLTLSNAWVDGIWPSTLSPYKIISPAKPRGMFTQDRVAGIAGRTDRLPEETTVTSRATMAGDGVSATTRSYIPRWAADSSDWNYLGVPGFAASTAPYRVENASVVPGSARATATVVVDDGTRRWTITRADLFDTSGDIGSLCTEDLNDIVTRFQMLNAPDIQQAHIVSVDFDTTLTRTRRTGAIVDVTVPGGIKPGVNTVRTTIKPRGGAPLGVDTQLTIPEGTSTRGTLIVSAPGWFDLSASDESYYSSGGMYFFDFMDSVDPTDQTVADVVADINAEPKNTDLQVFFEPEANSILPARTLEALKATSLYLTGAVTKTTTELLLEASASRVPYGGDLELMGQVDGVSEEGTVTILRRVPGTSVDTTVAQVPLEFDDVGASFNCLLEGLTTSAVYTARYEGGTESLPSESSVSIRTNAKVSASASPYRIRSGGRVTLKASVDPQQTDGSVSFQVYRSRRWITLKTVALTAGKTATMAWKPATGTHSVRAVFNGSALNAPGVSGSLAVYVR